MKRYLILGVIVAILMCLVWPRRGKDASTPRISETLPQTYAPANPSHQEHPASEGPEHGSPVASHMPTAGQQVNDHERMPEIMLTFNETHNVPVAFYGKVVDQDGNPLAETRIDLDVRETYMLPAPTFDYTSKTTHAQTQAGADGRFELTGVKGDSVTVKRLTKEGYEPELEQKHYGIFGAQDTTIDNPVVFRMWRTNIHESLTTGGKSFVIIPDGRHYAIDLINGTIAEGDGGDLVAWINRPESVKWGQRYDWSCEVTLPTGGMIESESQAMFIAPEAGYTNGFAYQEQANPYRWSGATGDRRFYIQLRNGQMYGRVVINLYANFYGKQPAMIELSYAINPSGSRLLR
jgi:hypothetical protein